MSYFLQFSPRHIILLSHVASSPSPWVSPHIIIQLQWLKIQTWCYIMTPSHHLLDWFVGSPSSPAGHIGNRSRHFKKCTRTHKHTLTAFLSTRRIGHLKSFVFTQHHNLTETALLAPAGVQIVAFMCHSARWRLLTQIRLLLEWCALNRWWQGWH